MGDLVSLPGARKRCSGIAESTGSQCQITAQPDSDYCWRHNPSKVSAEKRVMANGELLNRTLGEKIKDAEQQIMDLVPVAMQTVMEILGNPDEKAADRLKAAQLVLDRGVAQKIQAEVSQTDERDLDAEIEDALEEVRAELDRTGTDG